MAKYIGNLSSNLDSSAETGSFDRLQHNNDLIANIHVDDLNYLERDLEFSDKVKM